jgi:hypothetical protein
MAVRGKRERREGIINPSSAGRRGGSRRSSLKEREWHGMVPVKKAVRFHA